MWDQDVYDKTEAVIYGAQRLKTFDYNPSKINNESRSNFLNHSAVGGISLKSKTSAGKSEVRGPKIPSELRVNPLCNRRVE